MNAGQVINLAAECGVTMSAACKKSGVSPSTPHRWGRGQEAGQETIDRLADAILILSLDAGTIPTKYQDVAKRAKQKEGKTSRSPDEILQDIKSNVRELERAIRA